MNTDVYKRHMCLYAHTLYFMIHPFLSLLVANPHFRLLFLSFIFKATFVAMGFAFTMLSTVPTAVKCLFEKLH